MILTRFATTRLFLSIFRRRKKKEEDEDKFQKENNCYYRMDGEKNRISFVEGEQTARFFFFWVASAARFPYLFEHFKKKWSQ